MGVRFCDIGWLNVSVECCVFCSSVLFCEKKNTPTVRERMLESCRGVFSLTEDISFSHVGYFFLSQSPQSLQSIFAHVLSPQKAFGIQRTQSVSAIVDTNKGQHEAFVLLIGVSRWLRPFPSGEGKGEGPVGEGGGATISLRTPPVRWKASVHLWKSVRNRIPNRFPALLKKPDKNLQESPYE